MGGEEGEEEWGPSLRAKLENRQRHHQCYKGEARQLVRTGSLAPGWLSHWLKELHARLTKTLCSFRAPSSYLFPSQPITHTKEIFRLLLSRLFFLFLNDESNSFNHTIPRPELRATSSFP